jgi:hypothetical protein
VTDRFEVVAIGIDHERPVVVRVVVRPQARFAIVGRPAVQSSPVKGVDGAVVRSGKRDMKAGRFGGVGVDPQRGVAVAAETRNSLEGMELGVAKRGNG